MSTFFDLCATGMFAAAAGLFLYRLQFEDPPLLPYLVVIATCALGNWTGNAGSGLTATILLVAVGFLLVHLASQPFEEDEEEV